MTELIELKSGNFGTVQMVEDENGKFVRKRWDLRKFNLKYGCSPKEALRYAIEFGKLRVGPEIFGIHESFIDMEMIEGGLYTTKRFLQEQIMMKSNFVEKLFILHHFEKVPPLTLENTTLWKIVKNELECSNHPSADFVRKELDLLRRFCEKRLFYPVISHGDLKLNNLLLTKEHDVFFIDFDSTGEGFASQDFASFFLKTQDDGSKFTEKDIVTFLKRYAAMNENADQTILRQNMTLMLPLVYAESLGFYMNMEWQRDVEKAQKKVVARLDDFSNSMDSVRSRLLESNTADIKIFDTWIEQS